MTHYQNEMGVCIPFTCLGIIMRRRWGGVQKHGGKHTFFSMRYPANMLPRHTVRMATKQFMSGSGLPSNNVTMLQCFYRFPSTTSYRVLPLLGVTYGYRRLKERKMERKG